jgi:hypothetical protein
MLPGGLVFAGSTQTALERQDLLSWNLCMRVPGDVVERANVSVDKTGQDETGL